MAGVYSKRLGVGGLSAVGTLALYTVPVAVTGVINSASLNCPPGCRASLFFSSGIWNVTFLINDNTAGTIGKAVQLNPREPLEVGDGCGLTVGVFAGAQAVVAMIGGYELQLP